MAEAKKCPECGEDIPADAPEGLCPNCLLKVDLRTDESQAGSEPGLTTPYSGRFVPPQPAELAPHFPQLEILELLGQGGMGAVYKARQPGLDRLVALKILPREIGADPAFAERFTREARALARLSHPNIVAVYDFGRTADGLFYFLMEYVDGVNLRQAIKSGGMSPKEALAIIPQICDALQFAHDEGIVHRDIKPENVLVDKKGRVKIADFGLAKLLAQAPGDVCLTATQQVMGTLRYMAPEQMEGTKAVDHRADIYSLGVVFYELLTGEVPVGRFAPPSKKVQIDVRLDEIVLRALEEKPEQRYQHASEVKTEVEAIVGVPLQAGTPAAAPLAVALPQMLGVAIGLVLGLFLTTIGVLLIPAAFIYANAGPGVLGGLLGGAFGCLAGGLGSLAGSWNTYRQYRGQTDWMKMTRWTGLDSALAVYGLFGLALLLGGAFAKVNMVQTVESVVIASSIGAVLALGGLVVFQAAIFLMFRMPFILSQMSEGALGRISLRAAITGLLLPVLLIVVGMKLLNALQLTTDRFNACAILEIVVCGLLGIVLELIALGFGIAGRRTRSGKAGLVLFTLYWVLGVLVFFVFLPKRHTSGLGTPDGPRLATGGSAAVQASGLGSPTAKRIGANPVLGPDLPLPRPDLQAMASGPKQPGKDESKADLAAVQGLATRMLAAIADKDDAVLNEVSADALQGWRHALPQIASEVRESYQTQTGKSLTVAQDIRVGGPGIHIGTSGAMADLGWVQCRGPKELGESGLVLFFVKTKSGWRNFFLRGYGPADPPLISQADNWRTRFDELARETGFKVVADRSQIPSVSTPGREDYAFTFTGQPDHAVFLWIEFWKEGKLLDTSALAGSLVSARGVPIDATLRLTTMDGDVASVESAGKIRIDWQYQYRWRDKFGPASGRYDLGDWRPNPLKGMHGFLYSSWGRAGVAEEWRPKPGEAMTLLARCVYTDKSLSSKDFPTEATLLKGSWGAAILLRARFDPLPLGGTKKDSWESIRGSPLNTARLTPAQFAISKQLAADLSACKTPEESHRALVAAAGTDEGRTRAVQMLREFGEMPAAGITAEVLIKNLEEIAGKLAAVGSSSASATPAKTSPASSAPAGPGAWTSLFDGKDLGRWKAIEPPGHPELAGKVRVQDAQILLGEQNTRAVAGVSWTGELPTMDYEVEWEGMCRKVKDGLLVIAFPVGRDSPMLTVGGETGGAKFGPIDAAWLSIASSGTQPIEDGRWHRFRIRVSQAQGIGVWVDEKSVLDTPIAGHRFGAAHSDSEGMPKSLSLVIDGRSEVALRNLRVRSLPPSPATVSKPESITDLSPADARALLPEAASIPNAVFQTLTQSSQPELADSSPTLSWILLSLPADATKRTPAASIDFRFLGKAPSPAAFAQAMWKSKSKGYTTVIQPEFITDCRCSTKDDTATGTVSFTAPGLYSGKVEFVARRKDGAWRIEEFRLPGYGIKTVRGANGKWKKSEVPVTPAGRFSLEFRVVPHAAGSAQKPAYPEFVGQTKDSFAAAAVDELAKKGPEAAQPGGGEFHWCELAPKVNLPGALTGDYQGKKYVLLCAHEPYVMQPQPKAEDAWGLAEVSPGKDRQGHPQVEVRFNRRGGELLSTLTKSHVGSALAILVHGRVVSAPRIMTEIRDKVVITGQFSDKEAQDLIASLKHGVVGAPKEQ